MDILHPLAAAESLGAARIHFMDFSLELLDAIGNFGVSGTGAIFQFHCPMARDNQGADWLQKDSLLANPYYGSAMLKCGELVAILKE
jgi:Cu(I)/Ag(I) efflux system membrane fusion protein